MKLSNTSLSRPLLESFDRPSSDHSVSGAPLSGSLLEKSARAGLLSKLPSRPKILTTVLKNASGVWSKVSPKLAKTLDNWVASATAEEYENRQIAARLILSTVQADKSKLALDALGLSTLPDCLNQLKSQINDGDRSSFS